MVGLLPYVLIGLGTGFLVANVRVLVQFLRFRRLRSQAVLTWPGPRPPFYGLVIFLGVTLGVLIVVKVLFLHRGFWGIFGEALKTSRLDFHAVVAKRPSECFAGPFSSQSWWHLRSESPA